VSRVARYVGIIGLLTATAVAVSRTVRPGGQTIEAPPATRQAFKPAAEGPAYQDRRAPTHLAAVSPWGWGGLVLLAMLVLSSLGGAARALLVMMTPLGVLLAGGGVLWASYRDRIPNRAVVRIAVLVGAVAGSTLYIGRSLDHLL
jgi:hypothetical protein